MCFHLMTLFSSEESRGPCTLGFTSGCLFSWHNESIMHGMLILIPLFPQKQTAAPK
jgi:hypothetical protein